MSSLFALLEPHIWWLCAFAASIFGAFFYTANQYLQLPGHALVFWRGIVPAVVLFPFVLMIEWPSSPIFYGATMLTAMMAFYGDARNLQGASVYGGGVTSRMKPFIIWLVFVLWFVFHASYRENILADMPRFAAIVVTMLVGVLAAANMRKCAVSRKAFVFFIPIILIGAFIDLLNKTAMDNSALWSGILVYAWIQGSVIASLAFAHHGMSRRLSIKNLFAGNMITAGLVLGLCVVFINISKNMAMSYTVNPAYVTAIICTSPFWVSLYYKVTKHKEVADVRSGLVFVISAVVLVLLNS